MKSLFKIRTQCSVNKWCSLFGIREEQNLWGGNVFFDEGLVVIGSDLYRFVLIESTGLLFKLFHIEVVARQIKVEGWRWESWINFNGRELVNLFFITDIGIFIATNRSVK